MGQGHRQEDGQGPLPSGSGRRDRSLRRSCTAPRRPALSGHEAPGGGFAQPPLPEPHADSASCRLEARRTPGTPSPGNAIQPLFRTQIATATATAITSQKAVQATGVSSAPGTGWFASVLPVVERRSSMRINLTTRYLSSVTRRALLSGVEVLPLLCPPAFA